MSILTMNLVIFHKFLRKIPTGAPERTPLPLKMNELVTKCGYACLCTT